MGQTINIMPDGLLDDIWNDLVENIDDDSTPEELHEAIDSACARLNEFDPKRFPIEDDDDEAEEDAAGSGYN